MIIHMCVRINMYIFDLYEVARYSILSRRTSIFSSSLCEKKNYNTFFLNYIPKKKSMTILRFGNSIESHPVFGNKCNMHQNISNFLKKNRKETQKYIFFFH